jgi:uncharacterized repeat protein (TIGR02543 family)
MFLFDLWRLRPLVISLLAGFIVFSSVASGAEIRIAWDPNTEPDLAGYKVYWGKTSRTYEESIDVGNVTTYVLSGLTKGETYFIAVTAYDTENKESDFSNEVSGAAWESTQRYVITTDPAGLQVIVDGIPYSTPTDFEWEIGSFHSLSVLSPQEATPGVRYVFASWNDGGGQSHTVSAPPSTETYVASFEIEYRLVGSMNPPSGGTLTPSGVSWYREGEGVTVLAVPKPGYTFSGWAGDITGGTNPYNLVMTSPKSVTAQFTQNQYVLNVSVSPAGSGVVSRSPEKATYVYGETVTLTAQPALGYSFSGWSGDGSGTSNPLTVTIDGPKSVTAQFTQNQYVLNVSVSPTGSGVVSRSPEKATYVYGETVTLTAQPKEKYNFTSWSGDVSETNNPYVITIDGNKTVTANFVQIPETISPPSAPTGPSKGVIGREYVYSTEGALSNLDHLVEYQFDWKGDESDLSPWGPPTQIKVWPSSGIYSVRVRARCAVHTDIVSPWSSELSVSVKEVPSIQLINPVGGEIFKTGSKQRLSWVSKNLDPGGKIILHYLTERGWEEIAELPPTATSYYWTVPDTPMAVTHIRVGNWLEDGWECIDSTKKFFTISSIGGGFTEGGWVFDLLEGDEGGAAIWFEKNQLVGYGVSFEYGFFVIEGYYEVGEKGTIRGTYSLYDFVSLTERARGSLAGKMNKKGTKLTVALQPSPGGTSTTKMSGGLLLFDPAIPERWSVEITGKCKGKIDPLEINSFQIEELALPLFFTFSGPGFLSEGEPIEMKGHFILTLKDKVYGTYQMVGSMSDQGFISGKLDLLSGRFRLKARGDLGMNYIQTGVVKP